MQRIAALRLPATLLSLAALFGCGGDSAGPDDNPTPAITGISPSTVSAGGQGFTLTVNGTGFIPGSQVRLDGEGQPTLFVSETQISAPIAAARIATGAIVEVTVSNPSPGGGVSATTLLTVGNPEPNLELVNPEGVGVGASDLTMRLYGGNFLRSSVIRIDGEDRATSYLSEVTLETTFGASDLMQAASLEVTVHTPGPGGGTSDPLEFTVSNPRPVITGVDPALARSGDPEFTLTVDGTDFVDGAIVRWNGLNRPTTFISGSRLTAQIPASDVSTEGSAEVTVINPEPSFGESNAAPFEIQPPGLFTVELDAADLVYDPDRARVYAAVGGTDASYANSVAAIDPTTGQVIDTVFVGSNPGKMAISDDGTYLYVALNGAAAVRRVVLETFTAGIQFELGSSWSVDDMEVQPGSARTIAVSRRNTGYSPRHEGVAIYDDGVMRPTVTPGHTGSNVIEFSDSAGVLYGYNNETTEFGFRRMEVADSGVVITDIHRDLIGGFGVDIAFSDGRVYATTGAVLDAAAAALAGTFNAQGNVFPDTVSGRVFMMASGTREVRAFSPSTFAQIGGYTVPGLAGVAGSLIRWGDSGFAFRTEGTVVFFMRPELVGQ